MTARGPSQLRSRGQAGVTIVNSGGIPASTYVPRSTVGPTKGLMSSAVTNRSRSINGYTASTAQAYTAFVTDLVTISDAFAFTTLSSLAVSDTVSISDTAVSGFVYPGNVADTYTVSDTATPLWTQVARVTETIAFSETLDCPRVLGVTTSDSFAVSEVTSLPQTYSVSVSDTTSFGDSATCVRVFTTDVAETVTISDAIAQSTTLPVSDTVSVTDAALVSVSPVLLLTDTVTLSEGASNVRTSTASCITSFTVFDQVDLIQNNASHITVLDFVTVSDSLGARQASFAQDAETLTVSDSLGLHAVFVPSVSDTVPVLEALGPTVATAQASSSGTSLFLAFPEQPWPAVAPLDAYRVYPLDGSVPLTLREVQILTYLVAQGPTALVTGAHEVTLQGALPAASLASRYLTLTSMRNPVTVRVLAQQGAVLTVDQPLFPDTARPWRVDSGAIGATIRTSKMKNAGLYQLTTAFGLILSFTGKAPKPRLLSTVFNGQDGTVLLTFSDTMREDAALVDPAEYSFAGPGTVQVKRVRAVAPDQVLLETAGFGPGSYTLTVNAIGTPKDDAGNTIDPTFNQAVFSAITPLAVRSVFTDHGPIARPPLTLRQGTGVTFVDATTVVLSGGGLSSALVGRTLRLTGTAHNDGSFRVISVVNATRCRVAASFSLPDTGAGTATWAVVDPRHGQVADDPAHVRVTVNGTPVAAEAVVGLLGQVILPTAPAPTDHVKVTYHWVDQPTVDVQRLNSREFRLNNHARLFAGGVARTYAYQNTLVRPTDMAAETLVLSGLGATLSLPSTVTLPGALMLPSMVGLTLLLGGNNEGLGYRITAVLSSTSVQVSGLLADAAAVSWQVVDDQINRLAKLDQPLQRDLKYRAYERAYSATLNDPTSLVLNTPIHRIAYPPLQRTLDEVFVGYEPTTLPEDDAVAPWTRLGVGQAQLVADRLLVSDTTTGPFPGGQPFFWVRPIDTTFPHVLAMTWQAEVPDVPVYEGVWTGLAAGYASPERVLVIGYLLDGGVEKLGILRAGQGNDPSVLTAWTGGLDSSSQPTFTPLAAPWSTLHNFRVLRDPTGVIRVYLDGGIIEALRVTEAELPLLAELNDPFPSIQGVFFGSLSRQAESVSTWDYVRYTVLPSNPLQTAPSLFTTYEGTVEPEAANPPWTPMGSHGTETPDGGLLVLDSTSATDPGTSALAGLSNGDFRSFVRLEPLLTASADTLLDVVVQLRSHTHGPVPHAVMAAVDDGSHLLQLSLFPDRPAPLLGYGGRSLPTEWSPTPWSSLGSADAAMAGRFLRITDTSTVDGRVFYLDDPAPFADPSRVIGPNDFVCETRCDVQSFNPDGSGFAGVTLDVYDGTRALGLLLEQVAGVRYVTLHSEGVPLSAGRFAFDWSDGPHTYRLTKNHSPDLVTLLVDGLLLGTAAYTDFSAVGGTTTGTVSFGSSTAASLGAQSVVDWHYVNTWRLLSTLRRYAGLWKGTTTGTLRDFHLPVKGQGQAAVAGNILTDATGDFVARGVVTGDALVIDDGPNQGIYDVTSVTAQTLHLAGVFPVGPSVVAYRLPREVDWTTEHRYRIVRAPTGVVTLLLDTDVEPLVRVDFGELSVPPSSAGLPRLLAGGLPSITWGALDPTALTQTAWRSVRYGITRSPTERRIVPQGQVLNRRNTVASPEHLYTKLPHTHVDFQAGSDGIPPKVAPDFLSDPGLIAFTLLNEGTPLVPATQSSNVRQIQPSSVFVSQLNNPEDVLNTDPDFTLNDGTTQVKLVYPDDVLYSCLDVIETTTGQVSLLAPFGDHASFEGVEYQREVCLTYEAATLPELDTTASTPWVLASDDPSQVTTTVFGGALTYGTTGATRSVYRNATPLPDSPGLSTEVTFRVKVLADSTFGLGDSQIRLGLSAAPSMTVVLAFLTTPIGERYVLVVDLNSNQVMGGLPFDWYDGQTHTYRLTRDPGHGVLRVSVDT